MVVVIGWWSVLERGCGFRFGWGSVLVAAAVGDAGCSCERGGVDFELT